MNCAQTVRDRLDHLTVLYYRGCEPGFKFFGDDPEEEKKYIKQDHVDRIFEKYPDVFNTFPQDYLRRFYAHSRCLVFPDGVWMSETVKYPQGLRYRPGVNLSFRISGITRFTALTQGASAICVGIDPDADKIPCLRRKVHKIDAEMEFTPSSSKSILIPTENCYYGKSHFALGSLHYAKNEETVLKFEKPGFVIEFMNEPLTMDEALLEYCDQWVSRRIEVLER